MSDLFSEELGQLVSEQRRKRELARRRADFTNRLKSRQLSQAPKKKEGKLDRLTPDLLGRAVGQIAEVVKGTPRGIYEMAHQPALDIKDFVTEGDITPERTGGMFKQAGQQLVEDVRHPLRNPGYLFLDLLSLAPTPAAGIARGLRTAKMFRAVKAGDVMVGARQGLPHGRKPPSEGGESGAIAHPVGKIKPDVPEAAAPVSNK